jgi:hypothetical protein
MATTIPGAVDCWLPVADALRNIAQPNRSLKENLRVVRRERLQPEVSHTIADCDMFWQTMHAPFMRLTTGGLPSSITRRACDECSGAGRWSGCSTAASALLDVWCASGDTLLMVALGIANGEQKWVHGGAITALYRFCIEYAHAQRCTRIDFGVAFPILHDGLLRYKCRWGAQVALWPHTPFQHLLWWAQPGEPLLEFFAHTPVIFQSHGGANRLVSGEPGSELVELQRSLPSRAATARGHVCVKPGPASASSCSRRRTSADEARHACGPA